MPRSPDRLTIARAAYVPSEPSASANRGTHRDMLDAMFGPLVASITDPSVPPTTVPVGDASESPGVDGLSDVVMSVIDNLGRNGYQTGVAMVTTTIAIVAMLNIKTHRAVLAPVAVGAFWAGWLGWNTFSGQDNPLFPGDVSATKLWDVAFTSANGFLLVVSVACVAAIFLWRTGTALGSRVMLLVGAVLGASFLWNLVAAINVS